MRHSTFETGISSCCGQHFRPFAGWVLGGGGCLLVAEEGQALAPWAFMWLLLAAVFAGCKLLTWLNLENAAALRNGRLLGYLFFWPGMQPRSFVPGPHAHASDRQDLWVTGLTNLLVGVLLFGAASVAGAAWWLRAWLGMAGFSFVVHFGMFDLLAAAWRHAGVPVEKLFVCPVAARSLADFWGNRWNRAFSAFARDVVFRPLARRCGTTGATLAVFVFSGLAHELVISVPAHGGYGGPLLYFVIQGALVLLENSRVLRTQLRRHPLCARLWTVVAVLGPVPFLFHTPFLKNVVLPFLAALGG